MADGFIAAVIEAQEGDKTRRYRALVVGANHFAAGEWLPDLQYCARDALSLGCALQEDCSYDSVTVLRDARDDGEPLSDAKLPTRENVRRELRRLVDEADEDDVLLVHFSCHGQLIESGEGDSLRRRHYLFLHNAGGATAEHGLPLAEVIGILQAKSRQAVLTLDACQQGLGLDLDTTAPTSFQDRAEGGAFALLAGSTEKQRTQEAHDLQAGVFTQKLVEGLRALSVGRRHGEGVLFSALAQYVQKELATWRKQHSFSRFGYQTPVLRLEISDLEVVAPRRFLPLSSRASGAITSARFAPNGAMLATATDDGSVCLWDPESGNRMQEVYKHDAPANGVAFAPSGEVMVGVFKDGLMKLWPLRSSRQIAAPERLPRGIHRVAWAGYNFTWAGGHKRQLGAVHLDVIAVISGNELELYDRSASGSGWRKLAGHDSPIGAVAFSPNRDLLATGDEEGFVRVWSVETGEQAQQISVGDTVQSVAFSPAGRHLAIGCTERLERPAVQQQFAIQLKDMARVWDLDAGVEAHRFGGSTSGVVTLEYSPDGEWIAAADPAGSVRLWRTADPTAKPHVLHSQTVFNPALAVAFSPDRRLLFVGTKDGSGFLYDLSFTQVQSHAF